MTFRASLSLAALLVLPLGSLACADAPEKASAQKDQDQKDQAQKDEKAAPTAKAEDEPKPGSTELSAEELELIDSDPRALSPEQNRKRSYALRKKIMQNPDSPQAKALEEARVSALGGELTPEQIDPDRKSDKGVVIELPEHLKDQDVTHAPPQEAPQDRPRAQ